MKPFKASNKVLKGMNDNKWTFPVNKGFQLNVSRSKHSIIICFSTRCKKIPLEINNETIKPLKASNKDFQGMSDYKSFFYVK